MPQTIRKEKKKISLRQYSPIKIINRKKSHNEALSYALLNGSLTLEAALILPLFLLGSAVILSLFLMMQVQYSVANALDRAVADTALLCVESEKTIENLTKAAFYKELTVEKCPLFLVQGNMAGFSWTGTKIDHASIDVLVTYHLKFPINFGPQRTMEVSDARRMHRWTGNLRDREDETDASWVYVTPNQSVFHLSRNCSHLKLSVKLLHVLEWKSIKDLYRSCDHCAKGERPGTAIYVTEQGDCYHLRLDCSGLKRTIYMIKRSQAENIKTCSRCGGSS